MRAGVLALLFLLAAPTGARASPWSLPAGRWVLTGAFQFQWAGQEFLDRRSRQAIPLEGFLTTTTFEAGARWGLGAGFDLELAVPVQIVSFQSDPVILLSPPPDFTGAPIDFFQDNNLNFAQTRAGVSDIRLGGRKQWVRRPFALSTTLMVKIPAAYSGPSGTFGDTPESADEFAADPARFVAPENVEDDVTLGDGQVDVEALLHIGWASRSGLFFRGAAGYALRLDRAGDEFRTEARVGQLFGRRVLLFAGANLVVAVQEGRPIGVSVAAEDPELPATEFGGLDNLLLRELRLERDQLDVSGGGILRLTERYELNLSFGRTVWGRNTTATNTLSLSVAGRIGD
jgi:hypothetical protein